MIYLGGGGSARDEGAVFAVAFQPDPTKRVIIWPWAQPETSWSGITTWLKDSLAALGLTPELEIGSAPHFGLDNSDIIVIPGGNTFRLLAHMQKHDLIPRLKAYLANGGKFYGGSAGAVIAGSDIGIIDRQLGGMDPDEIGTTDRTALNLLNGWVVYPHFEEMWRSHCEQWSLKGSKVLAIAEKGGLQYENRTGIAVNLGPEDIWLFEQGKGLRWRAREEQVL